MEVAHVKGDKCVFFLFWDCLEPFYGVVVAFPQVHLGCLDDFFVYAVEDAFANDTNFRFAWIMDFSIIYIFQTRNPPPAEKSCRLYFAVTFHLTANLFCCATS